MQKIESWQIFHVAKKYLPKNTIQKVYTCTTRLVDYWAANPKHAQNQRNPLDRLRIILNELDNHGAPEFARAAIDYLAEPLGGHFEYNNPAMSDKGSVDGEFGDLTLATTELLSKIRDSLADKKLDTMERMAIKDLARDAKRQIDEMLDAAGINDIGGR